MYEPTYGDVFTKYLTLVKELSNKYTKGSFEKQSMDLKKKKIAESITPKID
jgi:hypothetical protein